MKPFPERLREVQTEYIQIAYDFVPEETEKIFIYVISHNGQYGYNIFLKLHGKIINKNMIHRYIDKYDDSFDVLMNLQDQGIKVAREFTEETILNGEEAPSSMKIIYDCVERTMSAKLTYDTLYPRPFDPGYGPIAIEREWFEEMKKMEETEEVKNQKENRYFEEFDEDEELEYDDLNANKQLNRFLYGDLSTWPNERFEKVYAIGNLNAYVVRAAIPDNEGKIQIIDIVLKLDLEKEGKERLIYYYGIYPVKTKEGRYVEEFEDENSLEYSDFNENQKLDSFLFNAVLTWPEDRFEKLYSNRDLNAYVIRATLPDNEGKEHDIEIVLEIDFEKEGKEKIIAQHGVYPAPKDITQEKSSILSNIKKIFKK